MKTLFEASVTRYAAGHRDPGAFFEPSEVAELAKVGLRPIDMYDVAEDHVLAGEPDWETVLLVIAVRRDFFVTVQGGVMSAHRQREGSFPAKTAELGGISWLPRIIAKARGKLRGELPDELMYLCGGDRAFLKRFDIHPADFLRVVWAAGDDDQPILDSARAAADRAGADTATPADAPEPSGDFCPV